jgi:integrase
MKILFWLNTAKKNKEKKYPVYCRITINKQRAEIATGIFLKKADFDSNKKIVKNSNPLADVYNRHLKKLSEKLYEIHFNEIYLGDEPSAKRIKEIYTESIKKKRKTLLLDIVSEYIKSKYNRDKNINIFKANDRLLDIIKDVLREKHKINININDCDYYFYDMLANYLRNEKKYSAKYIKRIIALIHASIRYANNMGYSERLPVSYKVTFKDTHEIIYLTEEELERLKKHRFTEQRLQHAADCFIIQCYTGFDYSTLKKFNTNNLVVEKDGLWIKINRQKVDTAQVIIPVFKTVKNILIKYNFKLPVVSNNKYNKALKEVAREIRIHKPLTTHVGRKTFATMLLNKDVPIETVSRVLGHSEIKVTQKFYAQITQMKISKDLRGLFS